MTAVMILCITQFFKSNTLKHKEKTKMKKLIIVAVLISSSAITFASELESLKAGAELNEISMESLQQINPKEIPTPQAVPADMTDHMPAVSLNTEVLGLIAGSVDVNSAKNVKKSQRQIFKKLLSEIANLSQSNPLNCQEKTLHTPYESVTYTIALKDVAEYQDAFFIKFKNQSRSWSSLVAYEGENGYVMGKLKVTTTDDIDIYRHIFDGFLDDIIILKVIQGKPVDFSYKKLNPQGVQFYSLTCKISM
jgi:hypothetical protein